MPEQEHEDTSGSAADSEAVFIMDHEAVMWGLAHMLVDGQSALAAMRRTADAAEHLTSEAPAEAVSS
jgi:hypothetical protein